MIEKNDIIAKKLSVLFPMYIIIISIKGDMKIPYAILMKNYYFCETCKVLVGDIKNNEGSGHY